MHAFMVKFPSRSRCHTSAAGGEARPRFGLFNVVADPFGAPVSSKALSPLRFASALQGMRQTNHHFMFGRW